MKGAVKNYVFGADNIQTAYIPVIDCLGFQINFSTRAGNAVVEWGDGHKSYEIFTKNIDGTKKTIKSKSHTYPTKFTGDIKVLFEKGLRDLYSIRFRNGVIGSAFHSRYNILDLGAYLAQFPNLYSYHMHFYAYGNNDLQPFIYGDLSQMPDSVERILIGNLDVQDKYNSLVLNLTNFSQNSNLKWFRKNTLVGEAFSSLKVTGDFSQLPLKCEYFFIEDTSNVQSGSAITYSAGKVWPAAFDTLRLPIMLTTPEIDNLLNEMAAYITSAIGDKEITLKGTRSSASDTAFSYLTGLGFTVTINP